MPTFAGTGTFIDVADGPGGPCPLAGQGLPGPARFGVEGRCRVQIEISEVETVKLTDLVGPH
jgi:hypothetical protein